MASLTHTNPDFVQLRSPHGIRAMKALVKSNKNAASLFYLLMEYMDKQNCLVASMDTLGELMDWSRSTTSRAVRFLRENNYVSVFKTGSSNVYTLNADVVWRTDNDKRVTALFTANVLLSLKEQDELVKTKVKRGVHKLELVTG